MGIKGRSYIVTALIIAVLSASVIPLNLLITQMTTGGLSLEEQYNNVEDPVYIANAAADSTFIYNLYNLILPEDVVVIAIDQWAYEKLSTINGSVTHVQPTSIMSITGNLPDAKVLVIVGKSKTLVELLQGAPDGGLQQDIKELASRTPLILVALDSDTQSKTMLIGEWMSRIATLYGYPIDGDVADSKRHNIRDGVVLDRRLIATGVLGLATVPWNGEPIGGFLHADGNFTVAEALAGMALEIRDFVSTQDISLPPEAQLVLFTGWQSKSSIWGKLSVAAYYYHYKPGTSYDVFLAFVKQSLYPYIWGTRGMVTTIDWHADENTYQDLFDWGPKSFGCSFTISFQVNLGDRGSPASISYSSPTGTAFCHSDTTDPSIGRHSVGHGFYALPFVTYTVEPSSSGIVDSVILDQGEYVWVSVGALSDIAGPIWHHVYMLRPSSQGLWGIMIPQDMDVSIQR